MHFLILIATTWITDASAFQLKDHLYMTQLAVQEFNECYPGSFTQADAILMVKADLEEDVNLVRKWTEYSHYYRPGTTLNMYRKSSMDRIESLQMDLTQSHPDESPYTVAGHIIHHLQDAASPTHVVPVAHGLGDGFESYTLDNQDFNDPLYRARCNRIRQNIEPYLNGFEKLLEQTALETLLSIRQSIPLKIAHLPFPTTWSAFWQESKTAGEFGEYGFLGNSFGMTDFQVGILDAHLSADEYRKFKQKQIRQAIESTKKALYLIRQLLF